MKLTPSSRGIAPHPRSWRAFTLTELMVSMAITLIVISGVISSHLVGLKMNEITRAKLSASDGARDAIGRMVTDIRSAKIVEVGNGTPSTFAAVASGRAQKGNALRVYPTTNLNSYAIYYRDSADASLKRATNNSASSARTVAQFITNSVVFTAENFKGIPLTESQNNRVIGVNLQFYQIQYPAASVGQGGYFDFYQLNTKITRRCIE